MKIRVISLCMLLFLSGCSANGHIERGMALRSALLRSASRFEAEITADYGDKLCHFTMDCSFADNGDMSFTVTAPESIAGITGMIAEKGGKLTFDDSVLAFPLMADDQISPVSAPWVLMKALRSGYLTSAGEEEGMLRLTIDDSYDEDALQMDIWLDKKDLPTRAEMVYDGRRFLSLTIKNMQIL